MNPRRPAVGGGRPLVFFLAWLVTAAPSPAQVGGPSLPDIGDPASVVLSPSQEALLGRTLLREIRRSLPLIEDPQLNSYIQSLGYQLVAGAQETGQEFTFLIVDDPQINAFASPGGIIAVNSGLMLAVGEEAELAAVIAHEIAHVTQRHLARLYARSDDMSLATGLAVLAAIVAAAYDTNLGQAALYGTLAAGQQSQLNFTRANEQEADRAGIRTLAAAGFDPRAMAAFFDKLQRRTYGADSGVTDYLRTHPVTTSRISDTAARADQMQGEFRRDSLEFRLMQARLRALTQPPAEALQRLEKTRASRTEALVHRYELALALIRARRAGEAAALLEAAALTHPDLLPIQLAYAAALRADGDLQGALRRLRRLEQLFPRQEPVALPLAETLIEAGHPHQALEVMEALTRAQDVSPAALKLKAEAAARAGRPGLSHETLADYYSMFGQFSTALEQLELALRSPGLDETAVQRLREKRARLMQTGKEESRQDRQRNIRD